MFTAAGPEAITRIAALGPGIFLDLKYHDIPNTVAGAVQAAAGLPGLRFLDLHTTGGPAMMKAGAAALAAAKLGRQRPRLLGITVLTSLDRPALASVGISGSPATRALSLAQLAQQCGLDGVVASPREVRQIREACGRDFLVVVPGIRASQAPGAKQSDDQARVATPGEAIRAGADYLVVGRPITSAPHPRAAAESILQEIASAMRARP